MAFIGPLSLSKAGSGVEAKPVGNLPAPRIIQAVDAIAAGKSTTEAVSGQAA
jgi:hypothetical protein